MLTTLDLTVSAGSRSNPATILKQINFQARMGSFVAIIGPSGCGKSTFLKTIAGLMPIAEGRIQWGTQNSGNDDNLEPELLAYVPQFGIFHEELTVEEILTDAAILRSGELENDSTRGRVIEIAQITGLEELLSRRASILSGGQKRRLALAMELISEPLVVLADEVTSGLDSKSSFEITLLLRKLASEKNKTVLHVTHELKHLDYYDQVVVLSEGAMVFQGASNEINSYFGVKDYDSIFERLSEMPKDVRKPVRSMSLPQFGFDANRENIVEAVSLARRKGFVRWWAQFWCLSRRRFKIFGRNPSQIILQIVLLFIFPGIVVLFALKGLPEIQNMSLNLETNPANILKDTLDYSAQVSRVGRLVSGLAMFQVILLALMGANNAAREIAAERKIFEKEKLSGLSSSAYLAGKIPFILFLVLAQSVWMAIFVKGICVLPGSFLEQFVVLGAVNLSLTMLSLAISSWCRTAEQASLLALYAVGFQLPLSGAVLALPDWLATATRPFIAAYWSWSGYLQTLKETRLYDLIVSAGTVSLDAWSFCLAMMLFQACICLSIAFMGCYRSNFSE